MTIARPLFAAIALACATVALSPVAGHPQDQLFVRTTNAGNFVLVYPRTASGDTGPARILSGSGGSGTIRLDPIHGELVVTASNGAVRTYALGASGSTAPLRQIQGDQTQMLGPQGLAIDPFHDELFVADAQTSSILVFRRTDTGNVAPVRTIAGPLTGLDAPVDLALDLVNDQLYVVSQSARAVVVFPRSANGNATPLRTLNTGAVFPEGIALDGVNGELIISNTNGTVSVYPRTGAGNTQPLRTIGGPATGFSNLAQLALDLANDEIVLTNGNASSVTVHSRTATGNAPPLRTLKGPATLISVPEAVAILPPAGGCGLTATGAVPDGAAALEEEIARAIIVPPVPLAASVLPSSRSVQVGCPATAFVSIINAGTSAAVAVKIQLATAVPVAFLYQTTNPATNAVTGAPNVPANIPAGQTQTFVISLTPTAPFPPTDVAFTFSGNNTIAPATLSGINTLLMTAAPTVAPDGVALAATLGNDGIVNVPGVAGTGFFAVATANVGLGAKLTVTADTGSANLPLSIALCQTDPGTGACISPVGETVTTQVAAGATPTFAIFVTGSGLIPFDPAANRVFVRISDAGGTVRGATSVAVRTQ